MSTKTIEQVESKIRQMPMYKVIAHNDPVTTFKFVTWVLIDVFNKTIEEAFILTKQIHERDFGIVGVYSLEHAEHLVDIATSQARTEKFPLTFSIEPD